ncbi:MAG: right-handed parallel beta-helix repeat-containing protein [Candidatus Bathyarchaeia archaeon]
MRKQARTFPFLIVLLVGMLALVTNRLPFTVTATYVEGSVTQDTVWTLTDSPFVLSKDVTVYPNATLTIEPGVEVRFGGQFLLNVTGRLIANGTKERTITFTSNKESPAPGDWKTIQFSGASSSILAYCSIKYAENGTTIKSGNIEIKNTEISNNFQNGVAIENGNVNIEDSMISNNTQNGIFITNGIVTIQNNTVSDNTVSGIFIAGGQVQVSDNTLRSNAIGLALTGNPTSANIIRNNVLSNTESGILLDAEAYGGVSILYNTLSANNRGFYVSSSASTLITNNSIAYNNLGLLYVGEQHHEVHWNDIYGNEYGMNVTSGASVVATYNYWGDESGPYHVSLNPTGKGNQVGGDGTNLDFIFFLTAPVGYVNQRPIARLLTDKKTVAPNQTVTFIGTTSSDDKQIDQYFFDFGDGKTSGWTTLSIVGHKYSSTGTFNVTLTVKDDFDVVSTNTAVVEITCQTLPSLTVSLAPSSLNVGSGSQISIIVLATNGTSPVENANVTLFSIVGGSIAPSFGLTNSTGHLTATFIAPNVTQTITIRIIAAASKAGFADGSDYENLMVLPPLMVQLTADPDRIKSEAFSNVWVHVTYNGLPVADATVTSSLAGWGSLDEQVKITDANGDCVFVFTAPQTSTQINVTITAVAAKSGYIGGQSQTQITVDPLMLQVQVAATPTTIYSEMTSNITVRVTYDSNPVFSATVVLSSNNGGTFSPQNLTTNSNGYCTFIFTSPQVTAPTNITITATVTKAGYAISTNQTTIAVNLGILSVQITADPVAVNSAATSTVTVHVTYNAKPVANAVVTISSTVSESFSVTSGTTDANGDCTFVFTAPQTSAQFNVVITAVATKNGYIESQSQTEITVNPSAPALGLPLPIILGIVAIIIVAVVILILIKLKIIVITSKGA